MKILPVGAELFHTDGRTYMKKLIVTFCNIANEPKNYFRRADSKSLNSLLMYNVQRKTDISTSIEEIHQMLVYGQ
jgi:hypothetical protein